jgi:hypothetical protein
MQYLIIPLWVRWFVIGLSIIHVISLENPPCPTPHTENAIIALRFHAEKGKKKKKKEI